MQTVVCIVKKGLVLGKKNLTTGCELLPDYFTSKIFKMNFNIILSSVSWSEVCGKHTTMCNLV